MKICVYGLWHLGSVTAACLAGAKFDIFGLDDNESIIDDLSHGIPPVFEPGLQDLVQAGLTSNSLAFTRDLSRVRQANLVWVTFDTPVNDADEADHDSVVRQVMRLRSVVAEKAVVLISSQLPVGTTRRIATQFADAGRTDVSFAYSPENVRLGRAIEVFTHPERIVIGCFDDRGRSLIEAVMTKFSDRLLWMSVESAEVVKHAINSFLALSITYANEIASVCEKVGADIDQVELGLRSDPRVGDKAYVRAGAAFAGGTLARDVRVLSNTASAHDLATPLVNAILPSNDNHRQWPQRRLREECGTLSGKTIAVLVLTYKPGTNTLRRSSAIELCLWLSAQGVRVVAFDPAVNCLPPELSDRITLKASALGALEGADALVVATEWPEFRKLSRQEIASAMNTALIIDQNRFMGHTLDHDPWFRYVTLGRVNAAQR